MKPPTLVTLGLQIIQILWTLQSSPLTLTMAQETTSASTSSSAGAYSPGKLRSLAEEAITQRDYNAALSHYQSAISLEPTNGLNFHKLYRLQLRMKHYNKALDSITNAVQVNERDASSIPYRFEKAKLLTLLGQCERAMEEYKMLTQFHTVNQWTDEQRNLRVEAYSCNDHLTKAHAGFSEEDYATAVHHYNAVLHYLELNAVPDILYTKCIAEFQTRDYYGVISNSGKLLKAFPNHIEAYCLRGDSYTKLGEFNVALDHYRSGLKLDPEHKGCKASHKFVKSITKKVSRGDAALEKKDFDGAIEYFYQALELDKENSMGAFSRNLVLKIAQVHLDAGNAKESVVVAKRHVEESESIEGFFVLGDALIGNEEFQEAVQVFQRAVEFEPNEDVKKCKEKLQQAQVALKQSKEKNYYKILNIPRTADKKKIKKAYRDMALKWHPDKVPEDKKDEAEGKFQDISEAYEVLSDEELKGKYDRGEEVFENQGGGGGQRRHHGFPEQMFRQHFNQGNGGGQRRGGGGQRHHFHFG